MGASSNGERYCAPDVQAPRGTPNPGGSRTSFVSRANALRPEGSGNRGQLTRAANPTRFRHADEVRQWQSKGPDSGALRRLPDRDDRCGTYNAGDLVDLRRAHCLGRQSTAADDVCCCQYDETVSGL